jgi:hypothetical protein
MPHRCGNFTKGRSRTSPTPPMKCGHLHAWNRRQFQFGEEVLDGRIFRHKKSPIVSGRAVPPRRHFLPGVAIRKPKNGLRRRMSPGGKATLPGAGWREPRLHSSCLRTYLVIMPEVSRASGSTASSSDETHWRRGLFSRQGLVRRARRRNVQVSGARRRSQAIL